jgi:hypothetical protein
MSRTPFRLAAMLFAGCCLVATVAFANSHNKDAAAAGGDPMEAMMKAGAPGPQHDQLKKMEGSWKTSVKSWMAPGEPTTSAGASECHMILGGRFLEERATGDMMGMPFEGHGLIGYDNMKKQYLMTWIDNMGTGIMSANGSYDDAKKTLTFKSMTTGMDGKPAAYRSTSTWTDDNTMVLTMYQTQKGKETKAMEITYTRQ